MLRFSIFIKLFLLSIHAFSQYDSLPNEELQSIFQKTILLKVTTPGLIDYDCYFEKNSCYLVDEELKNRNISLFNRQNKKIEIVGKPSAIPFLIEKYLKVSDFKLNNDKCQLQFTYYTPGGVGAISDSISISIIYNVWLEKLDNQWFIKLYSVREEHLYNYLNYNNPHSIKHYWRKRIKCN